MVCPAIGWIYVKHMHIPRKFFSSNRRGNWENTTNALGLLHFLPDLSAGGPPVKNKKKGLFHLISLLFLYLYSLLLIFLLETCLFFSDRKREKKKVSKKLHTVPNDFQLSVMLTRCQREPEEKSHFAYIWFKGGVRASAIYNHPMTTSLFWEILFFFIDNWERNTVRGTDVFVSLRETRKQILIEIPTVTTGKEKPNEKVKQENIIILFMRVCMALYSAWMVL